MNDRYVLICILVSAAATLFMRRSHLPFLERENKSPKKSGISDESFRQPSCCADRILPEGSTDRILKRWL